MDLCKLIQSCISYFADDQQEDQSIADQHFRKGHNNAQIETNQYW